ncbi:MAG: hypothetical protein EOP65_17055 [Sphingomonas sp.]|jgi:hypothetical protein|nr:MAG: hypothetical protein EOP65_17055 [Sphingomonas sp.]
MIDDNRDPAPDPAAPPTTDAHGEAAMLLVESLIHGLVARSVLSVDEAIALVTVAVDARAEIVADRGEADAAQDRALALLSGIGASLAYDAGG